MPSGGVNIDSLLGLARLEQRLKQLESQLANIQPAAAPVGSRSGGRPPAPTNLQFSRQPGVIAFEWDAVNASDLKDYRVQVANNASMVGFTEYITTDNRFVYYAGVLGTTYYARVASRNQGLKSSDFTSTLSTTIGTAVAADSSTSQDFIQPFFAQSNYLTSGNFFPDGVWTTSKLNSTTSLAIDVTIPDTGTWVVIVWGALQAKADNNAKDAFEAQIAIDGVRVGTAVGSQAPDINTGQRHGGSPFFFHLTTVNGTTYQYTIQGQAIRQSIEQFSSQIGALLIRTL